MEFCCKVNQGCRWSFKTLFLRIWMSLFRRQQYICAYFPINIYKFSSDFLTPTQNKKTIIFHVLILWDSVRKRTASSIMKVHCKKHHFVPNRCIYLNQSNVEATQDIYLLQSEFGFGMHILLLFQIDPITLNGIICFKWIYIYLVQGDVFLQSMCRRCITFSIIPFNAFV